MEMQPSEIHIHPKINPDDMLNVSIDDKELLAYPPIDERFDKVQSTSNP